RGLLEVDRAHVVARSAVPYQFDVGRLVGAGDRDLAADEIGIEVATLGQPAADPGLARLVEQVFEHVALARKEGGDVLLQVVVVAALALDGDVGVADPHRRSGIDRDVDHEAVVAVAVAGCVALDQDLRRVVAEGLQGFARLALRFAHEVAQPAPGQFAALRAHQRERRAHVVLHRFVQAVDAHVGDLGGLAQAAGGKEQRGGDEAVSGGHRSRIAGRRRTPVITMRRSSRVAVQRTAWSAHTDKCSMAATLPSRSLSWRSSARRLPRTAGSSTFTITASKNASTWGRSVASRP